MQRSENRFPITLRIAFGVLLAHAANAAPAWGATVGPVVIGVPEGFANMQAQRQGSMQVSAWTRQSADEGTKTLLQVTVYDFGAQLQTSPAPEQLAQGAEKYLREFLSGIERRRENYVLSPVKQLTLAGLPAARGTWKGTIGAKAVVGVMYCVVVKNRFVVSFHTQDLGSKPTRNMRQAMKSIEGVQLAP
jgi:hypothetical protein